MVVTFEVKGSYGSGMAGPKMPEEVTKDQSQAKPKKTGSICPFCEQKGHNTMAEGVVYFLQSLGVPNTNTITRNMVSVSCRYKLYWFYFLCNEF
jgi:hypothetical protein